MSINWTQRYCSHEWIPILLITSTVYDCKLCKVKKEDYEAWKNQK